MIAFYCIWHLVGIITGLCIVYYDEKRKITLHDFALWTLMGLAGFIVPLLFILELLKEKRS